MNKRCYFVSVCVMLSIILILVGCQVQDGAVQPNENQNNEGNMDKVYVLKWGHVYTPEHPHGKSIIKFAENVSNKSAGRLKIETYPNSELGGFRDLTEGVQMGTVDMVSNSHGALAVFQPSKLFSLFELYYVWEDIDHAMEFLNGPEGEKASEKFFEETGMRVLTHTYLGTRHVTNNKSPIKKPSDMTGLRLRVPEAESSLKGLEAMGGTPISMAFTELYGALQQGVIDGQENPYSQIYDSKLYEVQKYLSNTAHSIQMNALLINNNKFEELPSDLQKILVDEAKEWSIYHKELVLEQEVKLSEQLKSLIEVNDDVDREAFMKEAKPMLEDFAAELGDEGIDTLNKIMSR